MIDVARSFVETRLHEDNTKTSVAAPEERFALEFDHNGDSPRVLWRLALTSRETGLKLSWGCLGFCITRHSRSINDDIAPN